MSNRKMFDPHFDAPGKNRRVESDYATARSVSDFILQEMESHRVRRSQDQRFWGEPVTQLLPQLEEEGSVLNKARYRNRA